MKKVLMLIFTAVFIISIMLMGIGCKGETASTSEEGTVTEEATEEESAIEGAPFTIGISNSFINSEYRTQMISVLEEVNAEFMKQGITTELAIESEDTDVAGQIRQIETLISKGVDAILINPGDVNGLNASLEEAVDAGIIVFAVDQELSAKGVYNVAIDHKEWSIIQTEWLAKELGGKGDIVIIEGIPAHPANVVIMDAAKEVLAKYPDIKVVGQETGNWDQTTGQGVMSNFLASFPNLDGYLTQDGMAYGCLRAVMAANLDKWPIGTGEARMEFLHLWNEILKTSPDFKSIGVTNHPGVAGSALRIVVEMLKGGQIDETKLAGPANNTFYMPIPYTITPENFEEIYEQYKEYPGSYLLDQVLTQEEAKEFIK